MKKKAVFPSQYLQGEGILHDLPDMIEKFGSRGLLLGSRSIREKILPQFGSELSEHIPVEIFRGECCEQELKRIHDIIKRDSIDILIGMGGGKTIDTAKIAADRAGIPVIVVPTIASTDAPCSGCAVVYSDEGEFQKVLYQKNNPTLVLVDTNIIANAPVRFIVAGMGDALATWFEARSCWETKSTNECGGLSTLTGLHIAKLCYETLLKYGLAAITANEEKIITPALDFIIEANILLSGIGFESSGLAAAHAVHNGLTSLKETHSFYHGEKVAFGVLTGLHLNGASPEEIETVYSFCEETGLPTTFRDLGITGVDRCDLLKAAQKTCEPGSSIYHEAGEITPEKVLSAMIMADAMGKRRKALRYNPVTK